MANRDGREARETWQALIDLTMRLRARWMALASAFELTPIQAITLRHLDPERPVPMNTLAEGLVCDPSNVTGIVDKLEARGLVERRPEPSDRRVKMLAVTDKGARLRRRMMERMLTPPAALDRLSEAQQRCLREAATELLRHWDD